MKITSMIWKIELRNITFPPKRETKRRQVGWVA